MISNSECTLSTGSILQIVFAEGTIVVEGVFSVLRSLEVFLFNDFGNIFDLNMEDSLVFSEEFNISIIPVGANGAVLSISANVDTLTLCIFWWNVFNFRFAAAHTKKKKLQWNYVKRNDMYE